jgi:hypothetical protein
MKSLMLLMYTPFVFIGAMQGLIDSFAAPTEWLLSLVWWKMLLVVIFSILAFYLAFRIFFKLIELLAGLFH